MSLLTKVQGPRLLALEDVVRDTDRTYQYLGRPYRNRSVDGSGLLFAGKMPGCH
jgi:hypothetical protein